MTKKILYGILAAALLVTLVFALASCGGGIPELDFSGVSFADKTVDYNGEEQNLAVEGTLPEGVSVIYKNNARTNAGTYEVTAQFFWEGRYVEGADMKATLKINKVDISASVYGVSFNNSKVVYDGNAHSIAVVGDLHEAIRVTYVGNGVKEVGVHTVTAKFNVDERNYYPLSDMTATITIVNASEIPEIPSNLDLSAITLADKTVTYNGEEHSVAISGKLPANVTVKYSGNDRTDAGEYTVTASFYYKGVYIEGKDLTAELKINKATHDMSGVSFDSAVAIYTGSAHSLTVSGRLPDGVYVEYDGNGKIEVGEYTVVAKFIYDKKNYNDIQNKTATLNIISGMATPEIPDDLDLSGITLAGKTVDYNGEVHSLSILGTLPNNVTVEYLGNDKTNAGDYSVIAKFYYMGVYIEGADLNAKLVINKIAIDMKGVSFSGARLIYDGKVHSIGVVGTLPSGITRVEYVGNGQKNVGVYDITANFIVDDNHLPVDSMTATMTITIMLEQLNGLTFSDGEFVFDNTPKSIEITKASLATLPEGVELIGYEGNGKVNVGTYTVTAKFAVCGEYEPMLDFSATLTVKQGKIFATANDLTVTFDGEYHKIELVWPNYAGKPFGVVVEEINNSQRSVGVYRVTFRFTLTDEAINNVEPKEDITVTLTINPDSSLTSSGGVVYKQKTDGTYAVMDYTGAGGAVVIDATFGGKSVTEIASFAFAGKSSITSVSIPSSVTEIGVGAFAGCTGLTSVTLVEGLEAIGARAFENTAITSLTVPDTVLAIGGDALRGCEGIAYIKLPFIGGSDNSSKKYLGYIFGASGGYGGNAQFVPASLKTVELSSACTIIPAYSFFGCEGITEVIIGSGVTEIGISAFQGCTGLKGIYIPANVTLIRAAANNYNSPFYLCGAGFKIYLEADAVPAAPNYGAKWNVLDDGGTQAAVSVGKTAADFESDVNP